jgi:hypothetical protein
MNIEENSDINNKPIDTNKIIQKIETLQSQLPAILADFVKAFIFVNKTPEYPEYQQFFENIKSNLIQSGSSLFMISNELQKNTDDMNESLFKLNKMIKEEKMKNEMLKKKHGIIERKNNASVELISDYKHIYQSEYLKNFAMFLSIIVALVTIKKVYKSNNV